MMNTRRKYFLLCLIGALCAVSTVTQAARKSGYGLEADSGIEYVPEETVEWKELEVTLPAPPKAGNLREFYVSAVATNHYFIDSSSLAVGTDGVVRYVLVVRTAGGAENVSFEGIRCEDHTWKLYATGSADGQWRTARISEWRPIENKPVNRYHAALSREFFCPDGNPIATTEEGRRALQLGQHPNAK